MTSKKFAPLFALGICALAGWAVWEASAWDLQARLMPWVIGIPTAVMAAGVVVQEFMRIARATGSGGSDMPGASEIDASLLQRAEGRLDPIDERRRTVAIIGWLLGFALGIWLFGFHFGVPLATLLYMRLGCREGWSLTLALAGGTWLGIAAVFDCAMHIFFVEGRLFVWLGVKAGAFHAAVCRTASFLLPS